jgi:hypothetical protein
MEKCADHQCAKEETETCNRQIFIVKHLTHCGNTETRGRQTKTPKAATRHSNVMPASTGPENPSQVRESRRRPGCDIAHARRLCDRHGMGNPQSKQPARRARAAFQSLHGAPCLWVAGSRGAATNCYLITFHSEVGRTVSQLVAESPDAEAIIGRESRLLENKCIELRPWSSDRVAYFRIQSFGKLSSLGSHRWLAPAIEDLAFEMANECEHERPLIGSGHIFDRFLPNQLLLRAARR